MTGFAYIQKRSRQWQAASSWRGLVMCSELLVLKSHGCSLLSTLLPCDTGSRAQSSDAVVLLLTLMSPVMICQCLGQQVRTCGQGLGWRPDFCYCLPAQLLVFGLGKILGTEVPIEWRHGIFPDWTMQT